MGYFYIINHSQHSASGYGCVSVFDNPVGCSGVLGNVFTVRANDQLSIYYENKNAPAGTKVHFVDSNTESELTIPSGQNLLNNKGWINPWWTTAWTGGTYKIYAWDEYERKGTTAITLNVEAEPPAECTKEGQQLIFGNCCAGLVPTHKNPWDVIPTCEKPCIPNWVCNSPLDGKESDGCGNVRANDRCKAESKWICNTPRDGWEGDQYGNTRKNTRCDPISIWKCNVPLDGYTSDQYGNTKADTNCNPTATSVWKCNEPRNGLETDQFGHERANAKCVIDKPNEFFEKYKYFVIAGMFIFIILIVLLMRR